MLRIPDFNLIDRCNTGSEADHEIPATQRKTILTVTPSCCHWPIGDPQRSGFFFCGAATDGKTAYCKRHAQVAFRSVAPSAIRLRMT